MMFVWLRKTQTIQLIFFFLFGLLLYVPVDIYGHVETVNSHNRTFSWASFTQRLTSTSCKYMYFRL